MPREAPRVSVVVATRDRAERLRALLASLAAQCQTSFELIVADDGSSDRTPELLRAGVEQLELRAIRMERSGGAAKARNAGWREARAPLVACTDDDCVADPG